MARLLPYRSQITPVTLATGVVQLLWLMLCGKRASNDADVSTVPPIMVRRET